MFVTLVYTTEGDRYKHKTYKDKVKLKHINGQAC